MAVNYWHRRVGSLDGEPGVYHRIPHLPDFLSVVWLAVPSMQYSEQERAYWVPAVDSPDFERIALEHRVASPCGRCQRGEPCTAWADVRDQEVKGKDYAWVKLDEPGPGMDFDAFIREFYQQVQRDFDQQFEGTIPKVPPKPSGFAQATWGRQVDPPVDEERLRRERQQRLREERERQERETRERREREARERAREPAVQQPPDVRAKAARTLGVSVHADDQEIKRAVHRLAMEHHPDRGGDSSKMAEVLEARDVMLGKVRTRRRM